MNTHRALTTLLTFIAMLTLTSVSAQQLKQIQKGTDQNQIPVTNGPQRTQEYRSAIPYMLDTRGIRDTIIRYSGAGTVTNVATTAPITGGPITSTGTIGIDIDTTLETTGANKLNAKNNKAIWNARQLYGKPINPLLAPSLGQILSWDGSKWDAANAGGSGTVTSVGATPGTAGTDFNITGSPITTAGTFTFNLPTASATNRGALSSANWTTFNDKMGGSGVAGRIAFYNGTNSLSSNSNFLFDNASGRMGLGRNITPGGWLNIQGMGGAGDEKAIVMENSGGWVSSYIKTYNRTTPSVQRGMILGGYSNSISADRDVLTINPFGSTTEGGNGWGVGIGTTTPLNRLHLEIGVNNETNGRRGFTMTTPSYEMKQFLNNEGDYLFQSTTGFFSFGPTSLGAVGMNPSANIHLFGLSGVSEDELFKFEKSGGYGGTKFMQYYSAFNDRGLRIKNIQATGLTPSYLTLKSPSTTVNQIGISEDNPTQTLDVGGTVRIQSVTGSPTTIIGRNASGDVGTVAIGTGLSISGGTLTNTATAPQTWADITGHVINWSATGSFGSGKPVGIGILSATRLFDLNGDGRLRGAIYDSGNSPGTSGQMITSNGSGAWTWTTPAGAQNLSFGTKSGTDIALGISGGSGVIFREGTNIELVRTASNVLTVRQRVEYASMGIMNDLKTLSTSYQKLVPSGGSVGDGNDIAYSTGNNEIDVLTTGIYKIDYSAACKSNTASHTVTFDIINKSSGGSLSGSSLRSFHYFNNTNEFSHNNITHILNINAGTTFYLSAKTDTGTPNINNCILKVYAVRLQ